MTNDLVTRLKQRERIVPGISESCNRFKCSCTHGATGTPSARISLSVFLGRLAAGLLPAGTLDAFGTSGALCRPSGTELAFPGRGGSWPKR